MGKLKCLPSAFGNVVELRINTKGVGGKLPNFGFVVFDDSDPVQRILGAKVWGASTEFIIPLIHTGVLVAHGLMF